MAPKYTTVKGWIELTGMSRTGTYNALAQGWLRAIKQGAKTLIDVDHGLEWLRSQPEATFRPPAQKAA